MYFPSLYFARLDPGHLGAHSTSDVLSDWLETESREQGSDILVCFILLPCLVSWSMVEYGMVQTSIVWYDCMLYCLYGFSKVWHGTIHRVILIRPIPGVWPFRFMPITGSLCHVTVKDDEEEDKVWYYCHVDHNDASKPSHRLTNCQEPSKTIESDGSNIKKPS